MENCAIKYMYEGEGVSDASTPKIAALIKCELGEHSICLSVS